MIDLKYLARLAKHCSRLGLRVTGILAGVAGEALWEAAKNAPAYLDTACYPSRNGAIGSYAGALDAFRTGEIDAAEMGYYRDLVFYEDS